MRLAFVDNLPVGGGLSRFSLLLCKSLVENHPAFTIDYFIHYNNLKHIPEVKEIGERVRVFILDSSRPQSAGKRIIQKLGGKLGFFSENADKIIEEIEKRVDSSYTLAYFPSAHMMKKPRLSIPVAGTLHDFNWKYFFGREIFPRPFIEMMDVEILNWMNNGYTICSSQDVVDEALKLYPQATQYPKVVHIAPVIVHSDVTPAHTAAVMKQLKIDYPYIIFPGNFYPHKNHLNLFTAFYLLKQRKGFEDYKLILTGLNSDTLQKGIVGRRGVQLLTKNSNEQYYDVIGMGYQPNEVIDALIKNAKLLVSPSLYEAICTPGMDAWNFGTPTAISDIPPFREHQKAWGIKSAFFDPMNPAHIADVIAGELTDYERAVADGNISRQNMAAYTWKQVAEGYMNVFKKAIGNS